MPRHRFAIAVAALILATSAADAQNPPPGTYRPGLGDLMTMTVQPRHLKVGIAGEERNWTYVKYETHELEEAFDRITKLVPKWREFDIAALIASSVKQPLQDLEDAAKVESPPLFYDAYEKLTAACNACHQSANVGMIVIQAPKGSPFSNQNFHPQKP
ncbi:MAG: hypothetical protein JOY64_36315 [Alphaproteobacteria bacterium]|nr:hypothetical protein [Alphaproteobacteria bacterium]MBV8413136.1 hypothetical protein [Alphaproteobacteria bacterium]